MRKLFCGKRDLASQQVHAQIDESDRRHGLPGELCEIMQPDGKIARGESQIMIVWTEGDAGHQTAWRCCWREPESYAGSFAPVVLSDEHTIVVVPLGFINAIRSESHAERADLRSFRNRAATSLSALLVGGLRCGPKNRLSVHPSRRCDAAIAVERDRYHASGVTCERRAVGLQPGNFPKASRSIVAPG